MMAFRFPRPRSPALLLAALLCTPILPACSGDAIRDESPFAEVTGWRIEGSDLAVDLRLRNVNVEPMQIVGLELGVRLDEDVNLFQHRTDPGVEIAPGGFETLSVRTRATDEGTALLEALAARDRPNLPYVLEGTVTTEKSGSLPIRREGRIYTVPGRPGEFR